MPVGRRICSCILAGAVNIFVQRLCSFSVQGPRGRPVKNVFDLAAKILLVNIAVAICVSWILSRWYVLDVYLGAPHHQAFIHCDVGGWYVDVRRCPDMTIGWDMSVNTVSISEGRGAFAKDQPLVGPFAESLMDRFNQAGMWDAVFPGGGYLLNFGLNARGRGLQIGMGMRHWLLFSLAMFVVSGWSLYRRRRMRSAVESPRVDRDE